MHRFLIFYRSALAVEVNEMNVHDDILFFRVRVLQTTIQQAGVSMTEAGNKLESVSKSSSRSSGAFRAVIHKHQSGLGTNFLKL